MLPAERPPGTPRGADVATLTPRQREVALLVADGLSNKEIATRLALSPHTIKAHVEGAFRAVGVESRVDLAVWVVTHGQRRRGVLTRVWWWVNGRLNLVETDPERNAAYGRVDDELDELEGRR